MKLLYLRKKANDRGMDRKEGVEASSVTCFPSTLEIYK